MSKVDELITVSISSRSRPDVLNNTLLKLRGFGFTNSAIILLDDGSSPELKPEALRFFPKGRLLRNERSLGQASGRNRIARECETPFLLQLDDDSYPIAGDFKKLINWACRRDDWLAIALPFEEPNRGRLFPSKIPKERPIQLKAFVGCSVLINVKNFLEVGGYADWIDRTVEEEELCIRAFSKGYSVLSIDLMRIRHEVTEVGRKRDEIAQRSYRNGILMWCINAPLMILPWRLCRLLGAAIMMSIKERSLAPIRGVGNAIRMMPALMPRRAPVPLSSYLRFKRLPHMIDLFE